MQYALLVYEKPGAYNSLSDEERNALFARYWNIHEEQEIVGGAGLKPAETATTVRVQDGETLLNDGPFADTKEALAGYYLVEADDIDTAIGLASTLPAARHGGAIEIRPVLERQR